jgi:hypothetical protein
MDLYAAGTALGGKFAAVTAPSGTMGGTAIRGSSVGINNVPATPYIVVELPSGEVQAEEQGRRRITHDFEVYFLFQKSSGDIPRDSAVMLKWLGPLLGALESGNQLGIGSQTGWELLKSRIVQWDAGQYQVGGDLYHAWHFIVRVWTTDTFTVTP